MDTKQTEPKASLPATYLICRGGMPVPVTVNDLEQLRGLRTELELLRRVRRRMSAPPQVEAPASALRYSAEDRRELIRILRDAGDPIVRQALAEIDRDFPDLRKEVLMSVINEQAENIVQEAVESGAFHQVEADVVTPG